MSEFFHDSATSARALPGAYDFKPNPLFVALDCTCRLCKRPAIGYTFRDARHILLASYVHRQKPNGQPDICRVEASP